MPTSPEQIKIGLQLLTAFLAAVTAVVGLWKTIKGAKELKKENEK